MLSAVNPRVVTCSISGYGDHPQHRDRPGYDALVAARTGLLFDQKGRRGTAMEYICGRPGPESGIDGPEGLVRGADRSGPIFPRSMWPSIGAAYFATLGIAAALRAREVDGVGQRVSTSLLQGALASVCLNWQRVERPEAPLYWMWPVDARAIEGLYECADGRWVHHWTVRPRWVLSSSEGESLASVGARCCLPRGSRPGVDGAGRAAHRDLSAPPAGGGLQEVPVRRVGPGGGSGRARDGSGALTGRGSFGSRPSSPTGAWSKSTIRRSGRIRHVGVLLDFSATPGKVTGPAPLSGADTERDLGRGGIGAPADPGGASRLPGCLTASTPARGGSGARPRTGCSRTLRRTGPRRPWGRRHQGPCLARHLLGGDPHGPRDEPGQAKRRA